MLDEHSISTNRMDLTMTATTTTMDVDYDYWTNGTVVVDELPAYKAAMKLANQILLSVILVLIMLGMGCVISIKDIKEVIRFPKSVIIGMVSQFVLMPLTGFCLALALSLPAPHALGLLVMSCCPGGTVSNLFTFWAKGDVCLSICMTTFSTVAAIPMMPLNLFVYSRFWTRDKAVIPFINIVTSLICILVPVALGMVIRWKRKKWANVVTQLASILGLLGIAASITLTALVNPATYQVEYGIWVCIVVLPAAGGSFGYALSRLLRRPASHGRTIAFETGFQNVAIAMTLIMLTFNDTPYMYTVLTFPSLYAPFMLCEGFVALFVFRLVLRCRCGKPDDKEQSQELHQDPAHGDSEEAVGLQS